MLPTKLSHVLLIVVVSLTVSSWIAFYQNATVTTVDIVSFNRMERDEKYERNNGIFSPPSSNAYTENIPNVIGTARKLESTTNGLRQLTPMLYGGPWMRANDELKRVKSTFLKLGMDYDFGPLALNDTEPRIALFYNAYMNPNNLSHSDAIIREQLEVRKASSLGANAMLYYFIIGPNRTNVLNGESCAPCHNLGHSNEGFEEMTLQAAFEYCQTRPQDTILYFHNKGSFTDTETNRRLRRHATKGIFTRHCLRLSFRRGYNLCTAKFTGHPFAHCVGNMFVSQCDYIQHLIPPRDFEFVKQTIHNEMLEDKSLSFSNDTHYGMRRESWVGLSRYAKEHWIGSHPHLKPVSIIPSALGPVSYMWVPDKYDWKPVIRGKIHKNVRAQQQAPPFFQLEGRLYLYKRLYNETPPPDSWVWDFYNVTGEARRRVRKHRKTHAPTTAHVDGNEALHHEEEDEEEEHGHHEEEEEEES